MPEGTADAKRFEYQNGEVSEILFIENQAIVTRADVESVVRSPQQEDALAITVTEEGGKKLGAATKGARGDMRIAVLIDDKVVLAPVVNQPLGRQFVIEGLKEYPDEELDLLVWRIEGKSDDEIARLLRDKEISGLTPPSPGPEPEYYSDEEYAALKKAREKMGMFYLDELPTEAELGKRLKVGMGRAAVIAEFGKASRASWDDDGQVESMEYDLAPEKRSLSNEMRPDSFRVEFNGRKVTRWGFHRWSSSSRQAKPPKGGPRALSAVMPKADFARDDFDMVRWVEEIQLFRKEGDKAPTPQDHMDLLSIIFSTAMAADEPALIEPNCSVVKTLAEGFPEVEELRKASGEGKISLIKLNDLLKPYIFGEKPFPEFPGAP